MSIFNDMLPCSFVAQCSFYLPWPIEKQSKILIGEKHQRRGLWQLNMLSALEASCHHQTAILFVIQA